MRNLAAHEMKTGNGANFRCFIDAAAWSIDVSIAISNMKMLKIPQQRGHSVFGSSNGATFLESHVSTIYNEGTGFVLTTVHGNSEAAMFSTLMSLQYTWCQRETQFLVFHYFT